MAANPCVQCRVTPSTKTRLRAIAQEHQLTESALLKKLVETALLQTAGMTTFAVSKPIEPVSRGARLYVRLRTEDHVLLRERASGRAMAAATYASFLLRAHLRAGPAVAQPPPAPPPGGGPPRGGRRADPSKEERTTGDKGRGPLTARAYQDD